jgi:predicted nucleic acid-binding protein
LCLFAANSSFPICQSTTGFAAKRRKRRTFPPAAWDAFEDNLARLRHAGLPVPFPDALIATLAALNGLPIWGLDAHYAMIQPYIPSLRLFAGPTA